MANLHVDIKGKALVYLQLAIPEILDLITITM